MDNGRDEDFQIDVREAVFGAADPQRIDFARPQLNVEDIAKVVQTLESGWVTTGPVCAAFEAELADYLGVKHVIAVSSATTAEEICLAGLKLPKRSRIGVPTWTFASSALAIHRAGHIPVLLDIDPDDLNVSIKSLKAALADGGLDGLVGVHYAGTPIKKEIRDLCAEEGVIFIEDAAHALGTSDERGLIRGSGKTRAAFFSFYATKNLPMGEGGAIATDDSDLAEFARTYRLHGMSADAVGRYKKGGKHTYDIIQAGIKANLSDLHAAIGLSQLSRFDKTQAKRRDLVLRYRANLADVAGLRFIPGEHSEGSADHLAAIRFDDEQTRDDVICHLTANNVGTSVHFIPLHNFDWFVRGIDSGDVVIGPSGVANADRAHGQVMSLPLHGGLTLNDVDRVCDLVLEMAPLQQAAAVKAG